MNKVIVWVGGSKHEYASNSYDKFEYRIEDGLVYIIRNGFIHVVWKEWSNVSDR